jgi:phosphoglycolate phosphatase-like HAD superfamily hydrolase
MTRKKSKPKINKNQNKSKELVNLKGVFLDLDGTLINSMPIIKQSCAETLKKFGYKVSNQKLRELALLHSRDIAYYLMDSTKTTFDLHRFINYRRNVLIQLLRKKNPQKQWFKDSKKFLQEISKKYFVAIVTGSRRNFVEEILDKEIMKSIKVVITSDDVQHKKPDIEPLENALNKLRLRKEEIIFIGDAVHDGLMCRRLGVKYVAKLGGISTEKELRKFNPIFVGKNFEEIKKFIEKETN